MKSFFLFCLVAGGKGGGGGGEGDGMGGLLVSWSGWFLLGRSGLFLCFGVGGGEGGKV